jgi:MGT family glycosyltransferase
MTGPINAGMGLARSLVSKGHEVIYLGIPDCEPIITANHFNFIPVYGEYFPMGWINTFYQKLHEKGGIEAYHDVIDFVDYLIAGGDKEILEVFDKIQADMLIITASESDSIIWALLAHKAGLKTIYLYDVLAGAATLTSPPIYTDLVANGHSLSHLKIVYAWLKHYYFNLFFHFYAVWKKIKYLSPAKIKKLARYCNYRVGDIIFLTDMPSPLLKLPQLALFPKEFDFPNVKHTDRYYGSASIDINRQQEAFPWPQLRVDSPLVYTALSTLPLLTEHQTKAFFQAVVDAAAKWPEWDWVISIGKTLNPDDFDNVTANIILVKKAPQLELLKKAALMITHGGPSSIKECLYFGVPMIAFPLWFDQPGNVARLVYHGLGLAGKFDHVSKDYLQNLIAEAYNNQGIKDKIKTMQTTFIDNENADLSAKVIETFLPLKSKPLNNKAIT